jgi:hypothetical protein
MLPLKHNIERLHKVERYVQSRRKAAALNLPCVYWLFGYQFSFAVRFFEKSRELQTTLVGIEHDAAWKRAQKC